VRAPADGYTLLWPTRPGGRHLGYSGIRTRIIPLSNLPKTSNNIIQKGLAFGREQSGTMTVPGATRLGILPELCKIVAAVE